jgi:hypothetical protein
LCLRTVVLFPGVALPQDGYAAIVGGGAPGIEQYVE